MFGRKSTSGDCQSICINKYLMVTSRLRFSVVIPTYNRSRLLLEALECVFAQTYSPYEVIVVDDGSTDDTLSQLQKFRSRIILVSQANSGPGCARNRGAQEANGEFLCFLDSDDLWFPWTLSSYAHAIEAFDARFIAGHPSDENAEYHDHVFKCSVVQMERYDCYLAASADNLWVGTSATAVDRLVFLDCGGFDSSRINAEDSDLWLKLGCVSPFVWIADPPVFAYRRQKGSLVSEVVRTYRGMRHLLKSETEDRYPGGAKWRNNRREVIGRHVRPVVLECTRSGSWWMAFDLYIRSLWIHATQWRVRFLIGAFVLCLVSGLLDIFKRLSRWK